MKELSRLALLLELGLGEIFLRQPGQHRLAGPSSRIAV